MTARPYLQPDDCHCNASMNEPHARGCPQWTTCGATAQVTDGSGHDIGTCHKVLNHAGPCDFQVELHDAEQVVGHIPILAHRLSDEVYQRPTVQRETPRDFWLSFAVFAALIVGIYALVLIGAAVELMR